MFAATPLLPQSELNLRTCHQDATLTESLVMYQASVLQAVDQLETRIHELTIEEEERNAPQKPAQHRNHNKGDTKERSEDKSPFG